MAKVHLPKGTRDLLPAQMHHRLAVIDTIRSVFTRFGFAPLETPAFERIETLMGKYGDEGDKLIYKILKRGKGAERGETDLALRYDLTVPLARVVAMNPGLALPFKRYQIQPVWRADRPQKGRFREFYQCDVDIVGSKSPLADAECLAVVGTVLHELGFHQFTIRLNDRRLLRAMAEAIGAVDQETSMLVAIDKLDKIGVEGVRAELGRRGFDDTQIDRIFDMLDGGEIPGTAQVEADLDTLRGYAEALGAPTGCIKLDRTLARGLDYYTGPIFETVVTEPAIGSLSGGGRYDGLIGMFSGRDVPAVGVTLGLERIFVVMEELGMLGDSKTASTVWVTLFDEETRGDSLGVAGAMRDAVLNTELSLEPQKLGKQLKKAHRAGVRWAVVVGPDEATAGTVQLKDLHGDFKGTLPLAEAVARITSG